MAAPLTDLAPIDQPENRKYGIAAHEGALFGIANQILGTLTALFLIVLTVSGSIMWWRRRPTGLLGAPLPLVRPRFRAGLVAAIVALGVYLPLFGLTLMVVLAVEMTAFRHIPAAGRWLGLRARARFELSDSAGFPSGLRSDSSCMPAREAGHAWPGRCRLIFASG